MSTDETDEWGTADDTVAAGSEDTPDDPVSNYWLYVGIGLLTTVVAWLLIPLFGVGAVYAGYRLYNGESRRVSGGILLVAGALPLVLWALVLLQSL